MVKKFFSSHKEIQEPKVRFPTILNTFYLKASSIYLLFKIIEVSYGCISSVT
jgi:hypothetical protein